MKKQELIKKIAEEFDLDEIKVSEYFDNIFETLTVAFAMSKNVNISEFGKFKIKAKLSEDGLKQKTVLFSPVKKFAYDINYNFNELSPVQIRVLDDKSLKGKAPEEDYSEDEVEEIILIDFEEDRITEIEKQKDILIPEETRQDILHDEIEPEEEPEEETDEVLIPEVTAHEVSRETIPEEITEEIKKEKIPDEIPVIAESIIKPDITEESEDVIPESNRILEELTKLKFPDIEHFDFEEIIVLPEIVSKDKKIISEVTTIIKPEEKREEVFSDIFEIIKDKKKDEEVVEEISEVIEEEKKEEEIVEEISEVIEEEKKEEEPISPKTNLELEAELLKMLDERKKILEEIKKLENIDLEDLIDITKSNHITPDEKPTLFDEDILDKPKQNIFVDENGKILENLLKDFKSEKELSEQKEDIIREEIKEEEIIDETEDKQNEEIAQDIDKELRSEDTKEDYEKEENIEEEKYTPEKDINNLESLLGSLYDEQEERVTFPEPKEMEPHLNNPEMNIFDKLLEEPVKQEEEITTTKKEDITDNDNKDLKSFNELEKMFVTFKTEKTGEAESEKDEKDEKVILPVKKTETIKTYDDIFNLLEPNGKKNGKKPEVIKKEEQHKKFPPILKLIIPIVILIIIIFIVVYIYQRKVYKSYEETPQTQIIDSTKTGGSDSIIYADTNKTEEVNEEESVYNDNGFEIKHGEKGFFVHFGNFENQFELAKKIKELKEKNIIMEYEKITLEGKETYKIKAGPYKTLKEAKAIIPKL